MFCCNSSLPYQSFLTNKNLTWSSWRKMTDKRHHNIASPPTWLITQPIHWYHNFGSSEFACQLECEFIFFCVFFLSPHIAKDCNQSQFCDKYILLYQSNKPVVWKIPLSKQRNSSTDNQSFCHLKLNPLCKSNQLTCFGDYSRSNTV